VFLPCVPTPSLHRWSGPRRMARQLRDGPPLARPRHGIADRVAKHSAIVPVAAVATLASIASSLLAPFCPRQTREAAAVS